MRQPRFLPCWRLQYRGMITVRGKCFKANKTRCLWQKIPWSGDTGSADRCQKMVWEDPATDQNHVKERACEAAGTECMRQKGAARTESLRGGKQLASAAVRARRPNEQNVANRGLRVLRRSDLTELRQSRRTRTVFRVGWEHAGRSKQQGEKNRRTKPVILVVWLVSVSSFGRAGLVVTPETTACQAPQSMGLPRPGRVATRSSGDLPDPGSEPRSPPLQEDSTIWATREVR